MAAAAAGAKLAPLAEAAALAFAPALAGFILLPRLTEPIARLGLLAVWLVSAAGLTAGTGGVFSPVAAMFAIPPALALALGSRWAPEAGAASVLSYPAAAALAGFWAIEPGALSPFPEILAVIAIAFAAGLIGIGGVSQIPRPSGEIAEVSHELRTPLTHILGFAEMIERRLFGELNERYVEYAGLIRRSGNHLLELVNDLLDLSRLDAGRYELERADFDARALVEEVVRLSLDAAARRNIVLLMLTPEAPLTVNADARALRRILINLTGNALKFTPEGGRVSVTAARRGRELVLEVADTGPGIAEAERAQLGIAYARGQAGARVEGTGLGLSLVRALAQAHGGELSFDTAPGGGALVRVALPIMVSG